MEIKITGSSKEIKKLFDAISGSKEQQNSLNRIEQQMEYLSGYGSTN